MVYTFWQRVPKQLVWHLVLLIQIPDKVIFLLSKNVVFTMEIICHNSEFLMIEVI